MALVAAKTARPFDFFRGKLKRRPIRWSRPKFMSEVHGSNGKHAGEARSFAGGRLSGTVYVVDDDASFRTAVRRQLERIGYRVVTYASAEQVLERPPDDSEAGCILLDARMPGLSGSALHSRLRELGSTLPILFLTGYVDVGATVKAIKAGADDVLIKPVKSDELVSAIERALARQRATLAANRESDALRGRLAMLTPRERQVFVLVVQGGTNKHAARELGTSERTIKAHRQKVMEKMKAASLVELVLMGERLGVAARDD
jgi:FixJ family two-component response regulator